MQNRQNPDVNSIPSGDDVGAIEQNEPDRRDDDDDIERPDNDDVVPVPPDRQPVAPIEEPPERDEAPIGDVDDSPKRIAGDE
jgi:hypothetical protein